MQLAGSGDSTGLNDWTGDRLSSSLKLLIEMVGLSRSSSLQRWFNPRQIVCDCPHSPSAPPPSVYGSPGSTLASPAWRGCHTVKRKIALIIGLMATFCAFVSLRETSCKGEQMSTPGRDGKRKKGHFPCLYGRLTFICWSYKTVRNAMAY